jgi:hypothetical protein
MDEITSWQRMWSSRCGRWTTFELGKRYLACAGLSGDTFRGGVRVFDVVGVGKGRRREIYWSRSRIGRECLDTET